jgi:hypothetical protein
MLSYTNITNLIKKRYPFIDFEVFFYFSLLICIFFSINSGVYHLTEFGWIAKSDDPYIYWGKKFLGILNIVRFFLPIIIFPFILTLTIKNKYKGDYFSNLFIAFVVVQYAMLIMIEREFRFTDIHSPQIMDSIQLLLNIITVLLIFHCLKYEQRKKLSKYLLLFLIGFFIIFSYYFLIELYVELIKDSSGKYLYSTKILSPAGQHFGQSQPKVTGLSRILLVIYFFSFTYISYKKNIKKINYYLISFLIFFTCFSIYALQSRGGFLGLLIFIIIYFLFYNIRLMKKIFFVLLFLILPIISYELIFSNEMQNVRKIFQLENKKDIEKIKNIKINQSVQLTEKLTDIIKETEKMGIKSGFMNSVIGSSEPDSTNISDGIKSDFINSVIGLLEIESTNISDDMVSHNALKKIEAIEKLLIIINKDINKLEAMNDEELNKLEDVNNKILKKKKIIKQLSQLKNSEKEFFDKKPRSISPTQTLDIAEYTSGRSQIWEKALNIILGEKLYLGYGPQADRYLLSKYANDYNNSIYGNNVSNAIIYSIFCAGIFGFIFIISIYISVLSILVKSFFYEMIFRGDDYIKVTSFVTIIFICIRSGFENSFTVFGIDFYLLIVCFYILKDKSSNIFSIKNYKN